jgi:hypothetical protein
VLFELFHGPLGVVELGRLLKGNDAGRVVVLRKLPGAPSPDLASATDLARSLAHPRLAKVLGILRGKDDAWYGASEYVAGVSLFELGRAVTARGVSLDPAVAVRIVLDALQAANEAQQLLSVTANVHDVRSIFSESVWIATYGEVFVAELLIAPVLAKELARTSTETIQGSGPSPDSLGDDVSSALAELARLVGAGELGEGATVPGLREIFERFRCDRSSRDGVPELISALSELGSAHIADEQQVAAELLRTVGTDLARRAQKIAMLERSSMHAPPDDEATRYFRVAAAPAERDTTRPPPPNPDNAPQSGDQTALFRSLVPHREDVATEPPSPTMVQENESGEVSADPISVVWRQARALLDSTAQRAKVHENLRGIRASWRVRKRPISAAATPLDSVTPGLGRLPKVLAILAAVLALAILIRALWAASVH